MVPPPLITLLTDFGEEATWVAQMKGTILAIAPEARIVDLTHQVPPHDVVAGAYLLEIAVDAFPRGTIHVAVVDPGVGTARRAVVVRTETLVLVGPDNGLFSRVLERHPPRSAWALEAPHYRASSPSATFEGRDVFAPAAAWLARGTDPSRFGPEVDGLTGLPRAHVPPDHRVDVRSLKARSADRDSLRRRRIHLRLEFQHRCPALHVGQWVFHRRCHRWPRLRCHPRFVVRRTLVPRLHPLWPDTAL